MIRNPHVVVALSVLIALLSAASAAWAQVPDTFENLEVLPADISKRELMQVMRKFAGDLGVRCSHCHQGPDNLQGMDFATDEQAPKRVARQMMRMVRAINDKHLAEIETGREQRVEVSCGTCHHGVSLPRRIDDLVAERLEADGLDAAIGLYRELRQEHHGASAYDFSSSPLNGLAERLARGEKVEEALGLIELNIEFHPDEATSETSRGASWRRRETGRLPSRRSRRRWRSTLRIAGQAPARAD